jgi:hypothetical protein
MCAQAGLLALSANRKRVLIDRLWGKLPGETIIPDPHTTAVAPEAVVTPPTIATAIVSPLVSLPFPPPPPAAAPPIVTAEAVIPPPIIVSTTTTAQTTTHSPPALPSAPPQQAPPLNPPPHEAESSTPKPHTTELAPPAAVVTPPTTVTTIVSPPVSLPFPPPLPTAAPSIVATEAVMEVPAQPLVVVQQGMYKRPREGEEYDF